MAANGAAFDLFVHGGRTDRRCDARSRLARPETYDRLPYSLRVLLENHLRQAIRDGRSAGDDVPDRIAARQPCTVAIRPARLLLQDLLGIPLLVDLAALREAAAKRGVDPRTIEPVVPADLIVDHSLMAAFAGSPDARERNEQLELHRNAERFRFLRWCQTSFRGLRVVPPGRGIMHQINLEHLGRVVWQTEEGTDRLLFPDLVLGTDSHTPMINGLGIVGWGVGGLEAESALLGDAVTLPLPRVLGVRLRGRLRPGLVATDLVLTLTERLRRHGVVGKFVEFAGPELAALSLPDRATIANMAPEYGATCVFFPVDRTTVEYLELTGRGGAHAELVEAYCRAQGLWHAAEDPLPEFDETLDFDLSEVRTSLAGPRRPQDRVDLEDATASFAREQETSFGRSLEQCAVRHSVPGTAFDLGDGDVVIAAITSCTNTSNPDAVVAAALLARNAAARGLKPKPWVKTSFAPGSQVVADYLDESGLQGSLDALGFHVIGFGCTTCNGMSGPLPDAIRDTIAAHGLTAVAVLSGNRNFEARIHPSCRANYLASPALVVAYALAGSMNIDVSRDPLGCDALGVPVLLSDIWPSDAEIRDVVLRHVSAASFRRRGAELTDGGPGWDALETPAGGSYAWDPESTYLRRPPWFDAVPDAPPPQRGLHGLRLLAVVGDSITTDHLSPSGAIARNSPAGRWLLERGIDEYDFNTYGTRRGNHEVARRATFANIRVRNELCPETPGGFARLVPEGRVLPMVEAADIYAARGAELLIVAGREYGCGSSRDWAAKGVRLLGVRVVLAESFERIHRSNLAAMGVLPLEFPTGTDRRTLALTGSETFDVAPLPENWSPSMTVRVTLRRADGRADAFDARVRIDTPAEFERMRHGGLLPFVYRRTLAAAAGKESGT